MLCDARVPFLRRAAPERVQEVRVAANNFSSEFGRNGAALVNIITKQGSNKWHGTLGFYHTDNKLQAANEFQSAGVVALKVERAGLAFVGIERTAGAAHYGAGHP